MTQPTTAAHTSKDLPTNSSLKSIPALLRPTSHSWFWAGVSFFPSVTVMLSSLRSRLALPSHFIFLILNSLGLLLGNLHDSQIPDLDPYKSNLHLTLGWSATFVVSVYVCLALIFAYAGRDEPNAPPCERAVRESYHREFYQYARHTPDFCHVDFD
ncbi:hypothetical protein DTO027I6_10016 [Penicillium roqueforti]|nr:hypothetical protein CBS147337_10144 [Penicillium roqueforti]KAI3184243.1 hypothetical protein DTO027I6_10016 [Penicillium roqueforti]